MNEVEFYQERAKTHEGLDALQYNGRYKQVARHLAARDLLRDVRPLETLLDVGCGYGDFLPFVPHPTMYYGIDSCAEFIEQAGELYPSGVFTLNNVLKAQKINRYDAIVCIGMFTKAYTGSKADFYGTVEDLWRAAGKCLIFDTLSDNIEKKTDQDQWFSPNELMNFIINTLKVEKFVFSRNALPYVNMIGLYK